MNKFRKIQQKILTPEELIILRKVWKSQNMKVVFTNGCFDLIHLGHIDYLSKAADLGDKLIIGVNSDSSVSILKGKNRPIKDEITRMILLASFEFVDAVVLFKEETPAKLIDLIIPDILVKGGDYQENNIVGADTVRNHGGQLIILPFLEGHSTTKLEQRIIQGQNIKEK